VVGKTERVRETLETAKSGGRRGTVETLFPAEKARTELEVLQRKKEARCISPNLKGKESRRGRAAAFVKWRKTSGEKSPATVSRVFARKAKPPFKKKKYHHLGA